MALDTIVCATDFSDLSRRAAHVGAKLASRHGAELVVLYVDPPPEFAGLGPDFASLVEADLTNFRRTQDRFVEANLRKLASELRSHADVEVTTELIRDHAAAGIVEFIGDREADLLVIGHHGAGAHRLLLGSVAARVSRRIEIPTLVIPAATEPDAEVGNRILAAVDLVDYHSFAVARGALSLARPGSKLELFHAFYEPVFTALGDTVGIQSDLTKLFATARKASLDHLERLAGKLETEGVEIGFELAQGSRAREILARATEIGGDLIAVGSHGRRGWDRVIGTTAERVMRRADVPVLLVPTGEPK